MIEVASAAPRREIKFALQEADPGKLSSILRGNARRVAYGASEVSRVASIYFDDASLSACHESMAGVSRRTKVRLRWYDRPLAHDGAWLEVKARRNDWVAKDRAFVRLDRAMEGLSYAELLRLLTGAVDDSLAGYLRGRDQPIVLIAYRREHFVDTMRGVRITLDYDIEAFDQTGLRGPARGVAAPIAGLAVIEVKTSSIDPGLVAEALAPLAPRRTRSSKYVMACETMGWLDFS